MIDFNKNIILLDDSSKNEVMVFDNPINELIAYTKDEFFECLEQINTLKKTHYITGYIRYEAYKYFQNDKKTFEKPALYFGVYNQPQKISLNTDAYSPYSKIESKLSEKEYEQGFNIIKNEIEDGNTYQVNYTFDNNFQAFCSDKNLYLNLRNKQKTKYGAFIKNDFETVMSFSPELFFEVNGNKIKTRPMKGTIKRGDTKAEDEELKNILANDEKNRAENLMIVDLLRNDIARISDKVKVKSLFDIETYKSLHQMTSTIEGELNTHNIIDWLEALFPCGSITGAPKINTMKIIEKIEHDERGIYCGMIGYFSPEKSIFSVPIRILQEDTNGWKYRVGGGIVWDSEIKSEISEAKLKTSFLSSKKDFQLIETMKVENGKIIYEKEHIKRLENSAKFFGFNFYGLPSINLQDGVLRILLNKDGEISYENKLLPESKSNRINFSNIKVDSKNIFLQHKTTYRPWYNLKSDEIYDVIFTNEKDEITECSINNIFIEKNGILYTPPTECGLLNGTLRQTLIEEGNCKEKILYKNDIKKADKIFCGNSVRGLIQVYL